MLLRSSGCRAFLWDNDKRLIVELLIDGQSSFYPIEISMPQPNTIYEIENITIRSAGSEYSNFYEKKYNVECSVDIVPWQSVDIPNIDVGYNQDGNSIY